VCAASPETTVCSTTVVNPPSASSCLKTSEGGRKRTSLERAAMG
jgi:hypothetical protein